MVTYVPRDVDADLRSSLTGAAGGAVLLTGDSTAGKARAALESGKLDEAVAVLAAHFGASGAETTRTWLAAVSGATVTEWFEAAAASGPAWAGSACGLLLEWTGDRAGGERRLRQAAEAGEPTAIATVAPRLKAAGDVETAERLWSVAALGGDTDAAEQLASMCFGKGAPRRPGAGRNSRATGRGRAQGQPPAAMLLALTALPTGVGPHAAPCCEPRRRTIRRRRRTVRTGSPEACASS
ncbi:MULTISPECIES: hypothetical protein [unclassified Saccharothrix]|uniref:hypothetical protein n=1 Tax=unclassified Saccharothrix TaxID=2593673 RepID=UPI00307E09D0